MQRQLREWTRERRFEVAVCDFLSASLNFPVKLEIPTVLFQHNVESILWQRKAQLEPRWLDRSISKIEYAKIARYEPRQVCRCHQVVAVSDEDRRAMQTMTGVSHISVVPTGVDRSKYSYDPARR